MKRFHISENNKRAVKSFVSLVLVLVILVGIMPIDEIYDAYASAQEISVAASEEKLDDIQTSAATVDTPISKEEEGSYTVTLDASAVLSYNTTFSPTSFLLSNVYIGILREADSTDYEIYSMARTEDKKNVFSVTLNSSFKKAIFMIGRKEDISLDLFETASWTTEDDGETYTASYIATQAEYNNKLFRGYWENAVETRDTPTKIYYDNTLSGKVLLNKAPLVSAFYKTYSSSTSVGNIYPFGEYKIPNGDAAGNYRGENTINCYFTSSTDPTLEAVIVPMDYSFDFPDSSNSENLYEAEVPEGYDTVKFYVSNVNNVNYSSSKQIIPTEYENPCYFGGSTSFERQGIIENDGRGGTWGEVTDVNYVGDYSSMLYTVEANTQYDVDEAGNVESILNGISWVKATIFDYYNDSELSGVAPYSYKQSTDTINHCENLNLAFSDYYTENNEIYAQSYSLEKSISSHPYFPNRTSTYSQNYGIINPLYTIGYHPGYYINNPSSTSVVPTNTALSHYCNSWNLFGLENTVETTTDVQGTSYSSNAYNRFFTNNYGQITYTGIYSRTAAAQGAFASELDDNGNPCVNIVDPDNVGNGKSVIMPYFNEEFLRGNNSLNTAIGNVYEVYMPFKETTSTTYRDDVEYEQINMVMDGDGMYLGYDPYQNEYYINTTYTSSSSSETGWFYPLNYGRTSGIQGNVVNNYQTGGLVNQSFGVRLDIEFTDYIQCNFSSNDECIVYIDGKLVYDCGGCHAAVSGESLFPISSTVSNVKTGTLVNRNPYVLSNKTDEITIGDDGFSADYSGEHTMTVFFMERGMGSSQFNFSYSTTKRTEQSQSLIVEQSVSNINSFTSKIQSIYQNYDSYTYEIKNPKNATDSLNEETSTAVGNTYYLKKDSDSQVESGTLESDSFTLESGGKLSLPYLYVDPNSSEKESFVYVKRGEMSDTQKLLFYETKWKYQLSNYEYVYPISSNRYDMQETHYYPNSMFNNIINLSRSINYADIITGTGSTPYSDAFTDRVRLYNPGAKLDFLNGLGYYSRATLAANTINYTKSVANITDIITGSYTHRILFTNEAKCGTVDVKKEVVNISGYSQFTFNIVYQYVGDSEDLKEIWGTEPITDTFTVSGGYTKTLSIPIGMKYTITEVNDSSNYVENTQVFTGEITSDGQTDSVTFKNIKIADALTVQKIVQDSEGTDMTPDEPEYNKDYGVSVTLSSTTVNLYDMYSNDGWAKVNDSEYDITKSFTVKMSDGAVNIAENIPLNTTYTVEEVDSSKLGHEVTNGYSTGTITTVDGVDIVITNKINVETKDVEFYIEWNDGDNNLSKRPTVDEYKSIYKLQYQSENGTWVDVEDTSAAVLEVDSTDTNKWVYKIGGLTKFGGAAELQYRLVQTQAPDEYIADTTIAAESGTIVNTLLGSITITSKGYNNNLQTYAVLTDVLYAVYATEEDATNGTNPVYSGTTDSTGVYKIGNITIGDYWIVQTETPNGYNPLEEHALKVTVAFTEESTLYANVETINIMQTLLPITGGSGTALFVVSSAIMLILALFVYMKSNDRSKSK